MNIKNVVKKQKMRQCLYFKGIDTVLKTTKKQGVNPAKW